MSRQPVLPTAPSQILSPPPQLAEVNAFPGFGLVDSFGGLGITPQHSLNHPRHYPNESEPQQSRLDTASQNAPNPEPQLRGPLFPPRSLRTNAVQVHRDSATKQGNTQEPNVKESVYKPRTHCNGSKTPVPQLRTTSRDDTVPQQVLKGPLFPPRSLQTESNARVSQVNLAPQQPLEDDQGQLPSDRPQDIEEASKAEQDASDPLLSSQNLELFWKRRRERRSLKK